MLIQKSLLASLFVSLIFSCGIKGPPLPPIEEESVQKQLAADPPAAPASADLTKTKVKEKKSK